jgi:hypothetical protein
LYFLPLLPSFFFHFPSFFIFLIFCLHLPFCFFSFLSSTFLHYISFFLHSFPYLYLLLFPLLFLLPFRYRSKSFFLFPYFLSCLVLLFFLFFFARHTKISDIHPCSLTKSLGSQLASVLSELSSWYTFSIPSLPHPLLSDSFFPTFPNVTSWSCCLGR